MFGKAKKEKTEEAQGAAIPHVAGPGDAAMDANAKVKKLSRMAGALAFLAVLGLGFGVSAVATTTATLVEAQADQAQVLVAKADVKAGTRLTADMVEQQAVPAAYRSSAAVADSSAVVGKVAAVDIAQGEQVSAADFSGSATSSALASRLDSGKVAVCVDLTTANGFSGSLLVGDTVSVYGTKQMANEGSSAPALADDAAVIALGGSGNSSSSYATATFSVTAAQAKAITAAKADGGVSLVLHPAASEKHE